MLDRIYVKAAMLVRRATVDRPINLGRPSRPYIGCLSNAQIDRLRLWD